MGFVLVVGRVVRACDLFLFVPNLAGAVLGVKDFQWIRRRVRKLVVMLPSLLGVHNGLVVLHHRQPAGSNPGVLELHAHKAFFLVHIGDFPDANIDVHVHQ